MSDPTTHKALVAEFIDALFTRGELEAVGRGPLSGTRVRQP